MPRKDHIKKWTNQELVDSSKVQRDLMLFERKYGTPDGEALAYKQCVENREELRSRDKEHLLVEGGILNTTVYLSHNSLFLPTNETAPANHKNAGVKKGEQLWAQYFEGHIGPNRYTHSQILNMDSVQSIIMDLTTILQPI